MWSQPSLHSHSIQRDRRQHKQAKKQKSKLKKKNMSVSCDKGYQGNGQVAGTESSMAGTFWAGRLGIVSQRRGHSS